MTAVIVQYQMNALAIFALSISLFRRLFRRGDSSSVPRLGGRLRVVESIVHY